MDGVHAAIMPDGRRLHLQQGPIDLLVLAEAVSPADATRAFEAAVDRFRGMLQEIVDELPFLRRRCRQNRQGPEGAVAKRMHRAVLPHRSSSFVTPMAAVAGAVADEILAAMTSVAELRRAYVNNGGDIAVHLEPQEQFKIAVAGLDGALNGEITITGTSGIRGIATSGQGGRSHSLGIADSVTVAGRSAAAADAAATLVANAVDLPGHAEIARCPAEELDPDSDLGSRQVVVGTGRLHAIEIKRALSRGAGRASQMRAAGLLDAAALRLRDAWLIVGDEGCIRGPGKRTVQNG